MASRQTRQRRRNLVDQTLGIFGDGIAPKIWDKHRRDIQGYLQVQSGGQNWLSQKDFEGLRPGRTGKLDRKLVDNPKNALKLLRTSSLIREEVLGSEPDWLEHIQTLLYTLKLRADFEPISRQRLNETFKSAGCILHGAKAFGHAEQIEWLRDGVDQASTAKIDAIWTVDEPPCALQAANTDRTPTAEQRAAVRMAEELLRFTR